MEADDNRSKLILRTYISLVVIWIADVMMCSAQKPINIGNIKRRDVYIAGFFPYGSHIPESHVGRGVMPAVQLAVDHINENPSILRNYRLHMWWNDTECNAAVGVKAFFDMVHNGPHKLMLFGAACTQVTDPIAKASKHWRLTQLSYADTHPMFTSSSFPNFFRVVPSENAFNAPRVALLAHFNWTRVGTIYQNEPRYSLAHNRLVADLDENKMEVVETQSFAADVTSALGKLKEKDVRVILGNFNEVWARRIFCAAYRFGMFGRKYQWVIMGTYTEEWWHRPGGGCTSSELIDALQGVILTDLLPLTTDGECTISGITPDQYRIEYDSRRGSEYSRFHGYTYDGIWAVALAIHHVARRVRHFRRNHTISDFKYRDVLWEDLFLEALRNTSFEGVTGPVRFYDNERKAIVLLKQFQGDVEVKVGEFDGVTSILDLTRGAPLVWKGRSPPKDRTVHIILHSTVNITIYIILASAASAGIVMAVIFLTVNIKYRNHRYIKMSSPHLNNLIIIGCILTYISVIFLGLDSHLSSVTAFPYICTARAWLLMAGFSLAFGSMFSKTWRVHSIFTDVKLNKKVIKDYQLFLVVGVLLFVDMVIMTTWQVSDPFYRETKQLESHPHPASDDIIIIPENEYCQSNRMTIYLGCIYAYKGLLMIFGACLAWETRHVSIPALNDSKYVGMSVYNVVIMCVTGAAISFVLADKQDAMFIIIAVFIIFCSTATLCLVFVPKVIQLRRNPQGTIDKCTRATLRPVSRNRRESNVGELEERLKDMAQANQKFRKQLLEKDSELDMFMGKLTGTVAIDMPEEMDKLHMPKQDSVKEGVSITTETTEISLSMCSLNSIATFQPETDYVNVTATDHQNAGYRGKPSYTKIPAIITDNEYVPLVSQWNNTPNNISLVVSTDLKYTRSDNQSKGRSNEMIIEREPLIQFIEPGLIGKSNVTFVPEVVEEAEQIILEETKIPRLSRLTMANNIVQSTSLVSPSTKNVSFDQTDQQSYYQHAILPPPIQFTPHTERKEQPTSTNIQRSISERSRDKCLRAHNIEGYRNSECPHRSLRGIRGCRHTASKLRQQARLEHVQSTPNVAAVHYSKLSGINPRAACSSITSGTGRSRSSCATGSDILGCSISKMYSAVSDGELLDVAILPIFQKLLTERHKSACRNGYGSSIASCPNISVKCDIVEYL